MARGDVSWILFAALATERFLKPRFRSAVEGFKKACREKRFTASAPELRVFPPMSKCAQVRDFEYSKDGSGLSGSLA